MQRLTMYAFENVTKKYNNTISLHYTCTKMTKGDTITDITKVSFDKGP